MTTSKVTSEIIKKTLHVWPLKFLSHPLPSPLDPTLPCECWLTFVMVTARASYVAMVTSTSQRGPGALQKRPSTPIILINEFMLINREVSPSLLVGIVLKQLVLGAHLFHLLEWLIRKLPVGYNGYLLGSHPSP